MTQDEGRGQRWLRIEWGYWEWQDCTISQDEVVAAFQSAKAGRTCGADGVVSEQWLAALAVDLRIAACLAWAWNQRLQNRAAVQMCHTPSVHALVHACSAPACTDCPGNSGIWTLGPTSRTCMLANSDQPRASSSLLRSESSPSSAARKDPWREVQVQLLPELAAPNEFKLLCPISLSRAAKRCRECSCGRPNLTTLGRTEEERPRWPCKVFAAAFNARN